MEVIGSLDGWCLRSAGAKAALDRARENGAGKTSVAGTAVPAGFAAGGKVLQMGAAAANPSGFRHRPVSGGCAPRVFTRGNLVVRELEAPELALGGAGRERVFHLEWGRSFLQLTQM